ncbi:hypothetical protein FRB99_008271 [Tulasnella sp. 403]|nr:hypothetical protein FRB99_008271 [Tulasnella sp. 403]
MPIRQSSLSELARFALQLFDKVCDAPPLCELKPVAGVMLLICDRVSCMKDNQERGLEMAKRVARILQLLVDRMAHDGDGLPSDTLKHDVANLELYASPELTASSSTYQRFRVLINICDFISISCQRRNLLARFLRAETERATYDRLNADLTEAIIMFGILDINSLTVQTVHYDLDDYIMQLGKCHEKIIAVKKYYKGRDREFLEALEERRDLLHPNIAALWMADRQTRIMLFQTGDMAFASPLDNLEDIKRPWKLKHELENVVPSETLRSPSVSRLDTNHSTQRLLIKHCVALLDQLRGVLTYMRKMGVNVSWWQFDPRWVALRKGQQLVLLDWVPAKHSESDPEPQYMVHLTGLGFAALLPHLFQDAEQIFPSQAPSSPYSRSKRQTSLRYSVLQDTTDIFGDNFRAFDAFHNDHPSSKQSAKPSRRSGVFLTAL